MITTELILIRNPSPQEGSFNRPHILRQTQPFPDNKRFIAMWPRLHPTENLTFRETYQDVAFPVGPLLESSGYGTNKMSRPGLVPGGRTLSQYIRVRFACSVLEGNDLPKCKVTHCLYIVQKRGLPFF